MKSIAIEIPNVPGEHEIEVDVKINGVKTSYNYKVEIFRWEECHVEDIENRVECIGMPNEEFIPITFQKKSERAVLKD